MLDRVCQIRNGYGGSCLLSSYYVFGGKGVAASVAIVMVCVQGGRVRSNLFLSTPGIMGNQKPPTPHPPLPPSKSLKTRERARERRCFWRGGSGVQGDIIGQIHEEDDQ